MELYSGIENLWSLYNEWLKKAAVDLPSLCMTHTCVTVTHHNLSRYQRLHSQIIPLLSRLTHSNPLSLWYHILRYFTISRIISFQSFYPWSWFTESHLISSHMIIYPYLFIHALSCFIFITILYHEWFDYWERSIPIYTVICSIFEARFYIISQYDSFNPSLS
jgi:hypothetical protein